MVIWQYVILIGIVIALISGVIIPIFINSKPRVINMKKYRVFISFLLISSLLNTLINPTLKIIYLEVHTLVIIFFGVVLIKLKSGMTIKYSLLILILLFCSLICMYLIYPSMV